MIIKISSLRSVALASAVACLSACGAAAKPPPKETALKAESVPEKPTPEVDPVAVHVCSETKGTVEKGQVARIEIRGRRAPALLCERFPLRPGDPLETMTTDMTVRALYAEGRVEDVVVYKETRKEGVVVVYDVKIRNRVRSVKVRPVAGLEQGVADELVKEAPLWEDTARFDALVRDATDTLSERGYRRANITVETTPEGEDEVNVTLVVDPGPRVTVAAFNIEGFSPTRMAELLPLIRTKVGEPFNQEMLERDVLVMTSDLFDRGMVTASFSTPQIVESPDGAKVNILLRVTEGPVFKMRQVKFAGDLVAPAATYLRDAWKTKSGAVFSRKSVIEDVESVKRFHVSKGVPADVDIETNFDPKAKSVDVTVRIKRH